MCKERTSHSVQCGLTIVHKKYKRIVIGIEKVSSTQYKRITICTEKIPSTQYKRITICT